MKDNPVLTFPFPLAGIITSSIELKSYPAAPVVPFLGSTAYGTSFFMKNLLMVDIFFIFLLFDYD